MLISIYLGAGAALRSERVKRAWKITAISAI